MPKNTLSPFDNLEPFDAKTGDLNVVIETPKNCRNKYAYDEKLGIFVLKGVLAVGHSFPYDFGFVPRTLGGDGDPLDVLVLMDEPAFVGCLVPSRLVGVIEAEQTERDGKVERNDRFIAVAAHSQIHSEVKSINDLNERLIDEIEHFFIAYNEIKGKKFHAFKRSGAIKARKIVENGLK